MAATAAACRISLCVAQRSIRAASHVSGPAEAPREQRSAIRGSLKQVANLTSCVLRSALESKNALGLAHCMLYRDVPALKRKNVKVKVKMKLIYDRQSVDQSVLVTGAHLGPVTNFSFSLKFPLNSCGFAIL
jgi:hypothetical protein